MSRELGDLHPEMLRRYSKWKAQVEATFPQFDVGESYTRRTAEEQNALYKTNTPTRWVTDKDGYNNPSLHQYGLAVDVYVVRRKTGVIDWDNGVYRAIFGAVPAVKYGLEQIAGEMGHLQIKGGFGAAKYPWLYGLKGVILKT